MPNPKLYTNQLAVMLTPEEHAYVVSAAGSGSQGQVVRDALDLHAAVASGQLVTLTATELLELQRQAAASSLDGDPAQLAAARAMAGFAQSGIAGL